MTDVAWSGPLISYGQVTGVGGDYNEGRAPSCFDLGYALLDPRAPFAYKNPFNMVGGFRGWLSELNAVTLNVTPSAPSAVSLAAAQVPVAATPLTLVSASGAGVTVGASVVNALTGVTVTGLLVVDSAMAPVNFGTAKIAQMWDPTLASARVPTIASVGNDSAATFTVAGYDIYGYPMTQTITGASGATATGTKAFKYIASITPAGTLSGSNVTAGFNNNIIGLPLRSDVFADISISYNAALITANTGYTAAVTDTATATTGDVRGTYTAQSAFDGTKRLYIVQSPSVANLALVVNTTTSGLFGVNQF